MGPVRKTRLDAAARQPIGTAASAELSPLRRRSLSDDVVDRLLEYIADGSAPDRRLPVERVLCEQLDVSRTTVREALSTLTHLGVVETRGNGRYGSLVGARACLASRARLRRTETELVDHPLEVRRMLEPKIAALAAERASEDDLAEIAGWLGRMEESTENGQDSVRYDSAFHGAIARATGNPTLVFLINALTDALAESRDRSFRPGFSAKLAIEGHRAIVAALRSGDGKAASDAMESHLDDVAEMIRVSIQDGTLSATTPEG
jgi:GntR family transcriptional repressor for pyruvate dehydrogenase complex